MIEELILIVLLSVCCGFIGRVSGGYLGDDMPAVEYVLRFAHGGILAILTGLAGWPVLAACVLWWLGEKPGVGHVYGPLSSGMPPAKYIARRIEGPEAWQVLGLADRPWLSAAVRGAIYALPAALVLGWWAPAVWLWVPVFMVWVPLSFVIARQLPSVSVLELQGAWPWSEFIRNFGGALTLGLIFI